MRHIALDQTLQSNILENSEFEKFEKTEFENILGCQSGA
jgi:hypothetical protein